MLVSINLTEILKQQYIRYFKSSNYLLEVYKNIIYLLEVYIHLKGAK